MTFPRRSFAWRSLVVAVGLAAAATSACSSGNKSGTVSPTTVSGPAGTAPGSATTAPGSSSTASAATAAVTLTSALNAAYQAETAALATYHNVVSTLGEVGPFPNIIPSEQQHVATITDLLSRYAITPPATGVAQTSPATLSAACRLGVTTEQNVISMYTQQMAHVTSYPDVTAAFQNLLAASRDNHLVAFQRCA